MGRKRIFFSTRPKQCPKTPMTFLVGPTQPVISDKSFFIFEQEAVQTKIYPSKMNPVYFILLVVTIIVKGLVEIVRMISSIFLNIVRFFFYFSLSTLLLYWVGFMVQMGLNRSLGLGQTLSFSKKRGVNLRVEGCSCKKTEAATLAPPVNSDTALGPASPLEPVIPQLDFFVNLFLILILVFVSWILVRALWNFHYQKNPIPKRIGRTIFLSIILMFIAIPSFALLYSMDKTVSSIVLILVFFIQVFLHF